MKCWNCNKPIPETAKRCPSCEADVADEISPEEQQAVAAELLKTLDPGMLSELGAIFDESTSEDDFVNRVMVGDCPKCESSKTRDCENEPEIEDPCVGRCLDCGLLWCLDCGEIFKSAKTIDHDCPAWEGMPDDDEMFGTMG